MSNKSRKRKFGTMMEFDVNEDDERHHSKKRSKIINNSRKTITLKSSINNEIKLNILNFAITTKYCPEPCDKAKARSFIYRLNKQYNYQIEIRPKEMPSLILNWLDQSKKVNKLVNMYSSMIKLQQHVITLHRNVEMPWIMQHSANNLQKIANCLII